MGRAGLVRRGHALLRPLREGPTTDGRSTRRSRSSRATARGAARPPGRRPTPSASTRALQRRHLHRRRRRTTAPPRAARRTARASGRSRRALDRGRALRGRAAGHGRRRAARRRTRTSSSTSTTSTRPTSATLIWRGAYLLRGTGTGDVRPLRRRLEAARRPPDRRARHRRQRRVVGARADAQHRARSAARASSCRSCAARARGDDPGRAVGQARGLPGPARRSRCRRPR